MPTRKHKSFIDAFADETASLASPVIFRRWSAISLLSSVLEQRVWTPTRRPVYPNQYIFLIAHPGVGKTRIINEVKHLCTAMGDDGPLQSPVSMYFASLVDALERSKRTVIRAPAGETKYNSMYILADELGAFMHKYEPEMIDGLSAFYDTTPYSQERRTNEIKIKIPSPQINILAGSTPQNLLGFMPEKAWGQGFTSRIIMVFSDHRIDVDDFGSYGPPRNKDLLHDLRAVARLYGEFHVTEEYRSAVNQWKMAGEVPIPGHPRLTHYLTRRRVHIYKLSMIASVDRDDGLVLTEGDFFTALEWLMEAERFMPDVFKAGAMNSDSAAIDEILHFIRITDMGTGISEQRIVHFAKDRIPIHSILRIIEIMESSGQIRMTGRDKRTLARYYSVVKADG